MTNPLHSALPGSGTGTGRTVPSLAVDAEYTAAPRHQSARLHLHGLRSFLVLMSSAGAAWFTLPLLPPLAETPLYGALLSLQHAPVVLPVPVAGVGQRQLSDTWGAARSSGRRHEGIDIFARKGTPVRSTTEGIVLRLGTSRLGGKHVWVMGPGGQRHYYAHLDKQAALQTGDRVLPGTVLGTVGNTGNAAGTPPHLHYGIYQQGAQNPYPYLRFQIEAASAGAGPSVERPESK